MKALKQRKTKKIKKSGLLNWLKPQKRDALTSSSDKSSGCTSVSESRQDNEVIQEQINQKNNECKGLEETITALKHISENTIINNSNHEVDIEIEELKQKIVKLTESKERLETENQRLKEENSYAKELASAAAVELKILTEEIMKLMNQNEKLSGELAAHGNSPRRTTGPTKNGHRKGVNQLELLKREVAVSKERETAYEAMLSEKDERESELERIVMESQEREAYLENELANMWILVSRLRKSEGVENEIDVSESSKESGFEI